MKSTFRAVMTKLIGYFLAGVLAILPLVITVAIVAWVADKLTGLVGPETMIGQAIGRLGFTSQGGMIAYGLGWLTVLAVVFVLGVVVESGAKRFLFGMVDRLINRVPVLGSIYKTTRQLIGMLDRKEENELQGMKVVYCVFGEKKGAGFLALLVSPEKYRVGDQELQIVLVPTAPVPFGGGLLFVPAETIIPAEMSVDGLMSIYVSMGITASQFMPLVSAPGADGSLGGFAASTD